MRVNSVYYYYYEVYQKMTLQLTQLNFSIQFSLLQIDGYFC